MTEKEIANTKKQKTKCCGTKQGLTKEEIVQLYLSTMNLRVWHRLIVYTMGLSVGFWFLCPVLFGDDLPTWVIPVVGSPFLLMLVFILPKNFRVWKDARLLEALQNASLAGSMGWAAVKPTESERKKYPWIMPLYYAAFLVPLTCLVIMLVILGIRS